MCRSQPRATGAARTVDTVPVIVREVVGALCIAIGLCALVAPRLSWAMNQRALPRRWRPSPGSLWGTYSSTRTRVSGVSLLVLGLLAIAA